MSTIQIERDIRTHKNTQTSTQKHSDIYAHTQTYKYTDAVTPEKEKKHTQTQTHTQTFQGRTAGRLIETYEKVGHSDSQ